VLPIGSPGRIEADFPTVNGHTGATTNFDWNPFNDNMLASCSEDCTIKIWNVAEGGGLATAVSTLQGHTRKCTHIKFNPTANNALISAGADYAIKLWDIETGSIAYSNDDSHSDLIQDVQWDFYGGNIATSSKDKSIRILDGRTGFQHTTIENAHDGTKSCRLAYLGRGGNLLSAGFTKTSFRQLKVWDPRNITKPLKTVELDQAAGVMMPFFDNDTNMLYLAGKGDGNIRYYEMTADAPHVIDCDTYRSTVSVKGMAFFPKRSVDTSKNEICRLLRLTPNSVEPLSFIVPRKADGYQADLYPNTAAAVPAHSFGEWKAGSHKAPTEISMDPTSDRKVHAGAAPIAGAAPEKYVAPVTKESLQKDLDSANAIIKMLEAKLKAAGISY
jgi:coronin-1B/1C/6